MVRRKPFWLAGAAACTALFVLTDTAFAQTITQDAEPLIAPTLQVDSGMALARQQIGDDDLLGAVGTLERVLIQNPESIGPRLLYVTLLCRLDDRQGATVELNLMPSRTVPDANWTEVTQACGPMPRPGTGKKK